PLRGADEGDGAAALLADVVVVDLAEVVARAQAEEGAPLAARRAHVAEGGDEFEDGLVLEAPRRRHHADPDALAGGDVADEARRLRGEDQISPARAGRGAALHEQAH